MKCKDIHPLMTAYLDGELSPADQGTVREHLGECADCRAELEALSRLQARLGEHMERRALAAAAPAGAWRALEARLGPAPQKPARFNIPVPLRLALAVLIVLFLVVSTPSVRAGIRTMMGTILRFESPDGMNVSAIGGFEAFVPYHAAYLPDGFQPSGIGTTTAPDFESLELTYDRKEAFIVLVQRAGPGAGPLPEGAPVQVGENPAVFIDNFATSLEDMQAKMPFVATVVEHDYSHTHLLAWYQGEIKMEMLANVSRAEMEKVATWLVPMQVEQGELPFYEPAAIEESSRQRQTAGAYETFITLVFGFPGAIAALLLAALGVAIRRTWVGVGGLLLSLPFSFFLTATPRFRYLGWLLPGLIVVGLIAARSERKIATWIALALAAGFAGWIYWLVQA